MLYFKIRPNIIGCMNCNETSTTEGEYSHLAGFILKHQADLLGYANKLTHYNNEEAEDLFQETVYRSLHNANRYRDCGTTGAWLKTIMRNIYLNEINSAANRNAYNGEGIDMVDEAMRPDESYSISELYRAIEMLAPRDREIITRRLQGYSYAEIAQYLSMKEGTVKSSIHRIKAQLRQLLE